MNRKQEIEASLVDPKSIKLDFIGYYKVLDSNGCSAMQHFPCFGKKTIYCQGAWKHAIGEAGGIHFCDEKYLANWAHFAGYYDPHHEDPIIAEVINFDHSRHIRTLETHKSEWVELGRWFKASKFFRRFEQETIDSLQNEFNGVKRCPVSCLFHYQYLIRTLSWSELLNETLDHHSNEKGICYVCYHNIL